MSFTFIILKLFLQSVRSMPLSKEGEKVLILSSVEAFKSYSEIQGSRSRNSTFTWSWTFPLKKWVVGTAGYEWMGRVGEYSFIVCPREGSGRFGFCIVCIFFNRKYSSILCLIKRMEDRHRLLFKFCLSVLFYSRKSNGSICWSGYVCTLRFQEMFIFVFILQDIFQIGHMH